jgi:UPF0755 protein
MRRWLIAGTALAGIGAGMGFVALKAFDAPGPLAGAKAVVVPRGNLAFLGEALQRDGVINSRWMFRVAAALTFWQGRIHAAELMFPGHASLAEVLVVLRGARPVQHKLTIPEGFTAARIGMALARADGLAGEIELPAEGRFLPETYLYERNTSVMRLTERAKLALKHEVDQAWTNRGPGVGVTSAWALLIVASLVERETHLAAERPIIARVFYNRLAKGMRLQSDPTVVYGQSGGDGELAGGLSRADLERPSPYNTYLVAGLPVGPICSPGHASIEAAAHPASTNALYFVADGTGGHVFAESLDEHVRNVRRFRELGH